MLRLAHPPEPVLVTSGAAREPFPCREECRWVKTTLGGELLGKTCLNATRAHSGTQPVCPWGRPGSGGPSCLSTGTRVFLCGFIYSS